MHPLSRKDAPRGKIISIRLSKPDLASAATVVKESEMNIEGVRFGRSAPGGGVPMQFFTSRTVYFATAGGLLLLGAAAALAAWGLDGADRAAGELDAAGRTLDGLGALLADLRESWSTRPAPSN